MVKYVVLNEPDQKAIDDMNKATSAHPEASEASMTHHDRCPTPAESATERRIIEIVASSWTRSRDLCAALPHLCAPDWHRDNVNTLTESMVWGEIKSVEPTNLSRIHSTAGLSPDVAEKVGWLEEDVAKARAEFDVRYGHDVDVDVELLV